MNLDFSPAEDAHREQIREYLAARLPSNWNGIFRGADEWALSFEVTRELAEKGWLTEHWPTEYGGRNATVWEQTVLQEEFMAHNEPRGGQYMGVNWIGPAIMRFGSEEQKVLLLPEIARGEVQWAQLFSEADAGSDLAALRTRAKEDGDSFVVTGEKLWTSYAHVADRGFLLARSVEGSERTRGLSVFLIEMKSPGVTVREIESPFGIHRLHGVSFEQVRIPRGAMLGERGAGWEVAMAALAFERCGTPRYARATRVLGHIEGLVERTGTEDRFGKAIASALAHGRVAELMNYAVVATKERGSVPSWEASAARVYNSQYEQRVAELCVEVMEEEVMVTGEDAHASFGGEVESFALTQAPVTSITAGTFEIQMSIIARRGLGLPKAY